MKKINSTVKYENVANSQVKHKSIVGVSDYSKSMNWFGDYINPSRICIRDKHDQQF